MRPKSNILYKEAITQLRPHATAGSNHNGRSRDVSALSQDGVLVTSEDRAPPTSVPIAAKSFWTTTPETPSTRVPRPAATLARDCTAGTRTLEELVMSILVARKRVLVQFDLSLNQMDRGYAASKSLRTSGP